MPTYISWLNYLVKYEAISHIILFENVLQAFSINKNSIYTKSWDKEFWYLD